MTLHGRLPLSLLLAALVLVAVPGCSGAGGMPVATSGPSPAAGTPVSGDDDTVHLAVYFRSGEGAHAHLERVSRPVGVGEDLPRRALELLVAGPASDESGLDATLPPTTRVHDIEVSGGTARVVLSAEVVRDASTVGDSPANEALALAAIANTLTEFASVERVQIAVEGVGLGEGRFWGGWDLPGTLVRDETLIGSPSGGEGVPELGRFSAEQQTTGSDDADAVTLSAVRVRDRLTHVRVMVELGGPDGGDGANVKVPRVRARTTNAEIVLDVIGVEGLAAELEAARALSLSDPSFRELRVEQGERTTTIRLAVDDARERRFWLHSLTSPTRIVLDVKKEPALELSS